MQNFSLSSYLYGNSQSLMLILFLILAAIGCSQEFFQRSNTSSTRLQRNNFTSSKTSWRCLEDILQDIFKTSWKTKNCYAEDALKTSWRHVLKTSWRHVLKMSWRHILQTSWRHYGDKQKTYWGYLYLTNLNVYLTNLYFTNLYLTILRWIQNALIRTQ